ncbi:hypothetical protein KCP73_23420 [Salmonella enterica subsp. enterica]|nr:hypothetical protein KCP73_23420 [Salmonella enterica subsp. enterica]
MRIRLAAGAYDQLTILTPVSCCAFITTGNSTSPFLRHPAALTIPIASQSGAASLPRRAGWR